MSAQSRVGGGAEDVSLGCHQPSLTAPSSEAVVLSVVPGRSAVEGWSGIAAGRVDRDEEASVPRLLCSLLSGGVCGGVWREASSWRRVPPPQHVKKS